MQNSARCVLPVTSTSTFRNRRDRPATAEPVFAGISSGLERDLQLVQRVVPRLVDARMLAGRADEQAREQVRQRRVVVPVAHEAAQQIGPPQERAVGGRRAADDDVVAAAGAGVTAVEHELLGAEPRLPRLLVERRRASTSSVQSFAGCRLTSMTPGSGVTVKWFNRGSCGGGVPSMITGMPSDAAVSSIAAIRSR